MEREKILRIIEAYISKMPSLPTTVSKILQICNDPKTSPSDLNQVISLDPVLMGKVMKLINSAYYSLPNQITSLVRAIIMLGINTVKNLAISTAILGSLGKRSNFQAINMDGYWRHSICVGVTAKLIAKYRKIDKTLLESYFVAGLLHDLGKIPLNNKLSKEYVEAISLTDKEHIPLFESERRVLSVDHTEVGRMIIENWKLGKDIEDAVSYHHNVIEYGGENIDIVYAVCAANVFANTFEIGFSGDRYPEKLPDKVWKYLGIDWDFFDDIEDEVNSEIEKAQIFLRVAE